jgi:hypothetical protein
MNYSEKLLQITSALIDWMTWDFEKEQADWKKNGRRTVGADEWLKKETAKIQSEALSDYGLGITSLYGLIRDSKGASHSLIDYLGFGSIENFNTEYIQRQNRLTAIVQDIISLYNTWVENEFNHAVKNLLQNDLFQQKDFKLKPQILKAINTLVLKEKFKISLYQGGEDKILDYDKYRISPIIGFSSDLTLWLNHLQQQTEYVKSKCDNEIYVTLFGKLDEVHPLYSSWLITLHKGSSIWVVTDQVNFDNPYQKIARLGRKSVWEERYDMYDDCDLPYELFNNLEDITPDGTSVAKNSHFKRIATDIKSKLKELWRTNENHKQKDIVKQEIARILDSEKITYSVIYAEREKYNGDYEIGYAKKDGRVVAYWNGDAEEIIIYNKPNFFFKDLTTLTDGQKSFFVLLVSEIINYMSLANFEPQQVMLAENFVHQKMLEGATINTQEETLMTYWTDEHKIRFNELLETLEDTDDEPKTTALALLDYSLVLQTKEFESSWLATPHKLKSLAEWSILNAEKEKLSPRIQALKETEDEAQLWLREKMNEQYHQIVEKISLAKEIKFKTQIFDTFGKNGNLDSSGYISDRKLHNKVSSKRGFGIGKKTWAEEDCFMCLKNSNILLPKPAKMVKIVHVRHYKELMWLLDLTDRKQLPRYYRQYRAHNLTPYKGNSNLDQTHPYLRAYDPASDRNSNGITYFIYMCGNCFRKIKPETDLQVIEYQNY